MVSNDFVLSSATRRLTIYSMGGGICDSLGVLVVDGAIDPDRSGQQTDSP
ncbi:MAG: hypothetical protein QOF15_3167 [Mycobacterium sp.]|jgi:hypothetical protein|nr:hypothetical protein [Mycobacterium sp.]